MIGSFLRGTLWRAALKSLGGLSIGGRTPDGPCVVVANHSSHADTAALLAALPRRRRPVVAAAADYWFGRSGRALAARTLAGVFPVRRSGGGGTDLLAAESYLRKGRIVIVYPEGTRSRDGELAPFRSGAARLASSAGVPLVPVAIDGTRELLPVHGRVRRHRVGVCYGPATHDIATAHDRVASMLRGDR